MNNRQKNRCRHFNDISHDLCRAGEFYNKHDVNQCVGDKEATCPYYERFTDEELLAKRERIKKDLINAKIARQEIVKALNGKPGYGSMTCPVCKDGLLSYCMSENGHVRASCTNKCIGRME